MGNGAGNGYAVGHGTQGATADDLWKMEGGGARNIQYADPEKPRGGGGSKKWIWIGAIALLLCIGVGVGVGVGVSQSSKSNKSGSAASNSGSGSSDSGSPATGGTTIPDGSDPSKFEKDDRLKQVFWGLAYTPKVSISRRRCLDAETHLSRTPSTPTAGPTFLLSRATFSSCRS